MRCIKCYSPLIILPVIICMIIAGCSGGGAGGVSPAPSEAAAKAGESHITWGLWQFAADPIAGTLDMAQLRTTEMHLNALPFLEPPPLVNLTLESLEFNGNIIEADIGLRHPFLGLNEFTGFDVCGVLITSGSISGFENPDLIMAGTGDTRLLNPDGYTRWWNPAEFPHNNTMFAYKDGLLGPPDSVGHYNSTVNAYKFFCDDLADPDAPVSSLSPPNRCIFSAGQKNIRHYTIELGSVGLVFNYAVDACWQFPQGSPPYQVPDDFPASANRPEAWNIAVTEVNNTLWNDGASSGGDLSMLIDVWDHFDASINSVVVESPGNIALASSSTPVGGGDGYSTYQVDIIGATPAQGTIDILVEIHCGQTGYQELLPGEDVTAYFIHTATVSSQGFLLTAPNGGEEWEGFTHNNITWVAPGSVDYVDITYSKDDFASDINEVVTHFANSGTYDWLVPDDPSTTVKVRIKESSGTLEDDSNNYFTILESTCDFGAEGFTLAQAYDYVPNCWSHKGIVVTKQDPTQRVIGQSWPGEGNGGIIKIFNASNPLGGAVAQYDTGDLIYCNNDQAMWMDSLSVPGFDRILYNNFGSGSPTPNYQLKAIDWDGSAFVNPQTLPKPDTSGIWNLCVTPDGDLITHNATSLAPKFWFYDKSNNYSATFLFQLQLSTCPFGSVGNLRAMVYDPTLNAIILMCNNSSASVDGQLFVLSMTGELLFQDLHIFNATEQIAWNTGLNIDLEEPGCRILCYAGSSLYNGNAWMARYSADLDEKKVYALNGFSYGVCRGDLQTDGTLWATPDTGVARFYKFTHPADW